MKEKDINQYNHNSSLKEQDEKQSERDVQNECAPEKEQDKKGDDLTEPEKEKEKEGEDISGDKETETELLKKDLETLRMEKDEVVGLLQRVKADFDNYRKRTVAEKEEIRSYALFDFVCKIIPVLDNLDRAMESAENKDVPKTYIEGLDMIRKQISQLLEQHGVSPIDALGCSFDPHFHEAVMQTDEGENEPNTVVEEFQRGYVMKDRVLRPAMVKVYTGAGPSSEEE